MLLYPTICILIYSYVFTSTSPILRKYISNGGQRVRFSFIFSLIFAIAVFGWRYSSAPHQRQFS